MPRTDLLSSGTAFPLERAAVLACLDPQAPQDTPFAQALEHSLAVLDPKARRGALAGVTGHVAESVAEVLLAERRWSPVWHFGGPGGHGVDLLMLSPGAERLFAVEVKGTLRPRQWPRLRGDRVLQMAIEWLDKQDNPGMREWDVTSDDVYGATVLINFHDLLFKVALSSDFERWFELERLEQLDDLGWFEPHGHADGVATLNLAHRPPW